MGNVKNTKHKHFLFKVTYFCKTINFVWYIPISVIVSLKLKMMPHFRQLLPKLSDIIIIWIENSLKNCVGKFLNHTYSKCLQLRYIYQSCCCQTEPVTSSRSEMIHNIHYKKCLWNFLLSWMEYILLNKLYVSWERTVNEWNLSGIL